MLKKICPWCGNKATLSQLGRRPVKQKPKWFQFSKSVQVCPYCAGAVKPGGKALWFLVLALPTFLSVLGELFIGIDFLGELQVKNIGWVLLFIGFCGVYVFAKMEKVEGV